MRHIEEVSRMISFCVDEADDGLCKVQVLLDNSPVGDELFLYPEEIEVLEDWIADNPEEADFAFKDAVTLDAGLDKIIKDAFDEEEMRLMHEELDSRKPHLKEGFKELEEEGWEVGYTPEADVWWVVNERYDVAEEFDTESDAYAYIADFEGLDIQGE